METFSEVPSGWAIAPSPDNRPGQLGRDRDNKYKRWNAKYGKRRDYTTGGYQSWRDHDVGWDLLWVWGDSFISRQGACEVYEDAYYAYSFSNPSRWRRLLKRARDVYDIELSDKQSGLDYNLQQSVADHLQDIAIRRVVMRRGWKFKGGSDIRVRDPKVRGDFGYLFSPGKVPFHMPESIVHPHLNGWWGKNSIEDWYQSNKILVVKESKL